MIYFDKNKQAYAYKIDEYVCIVDEEIWNQYADTDKWDIINGVFTDISETQEYKEKKEKEEKERIANLQCTKRVLILMLEELGLDYFEQIEPLINANRQAKLEWQLCDKLERKNPLLDKIGAELKISPEQLDRLFLYANGEVPNLV